VTSVSFSARARLGVAAVLTSIRGAREISTALAAGALTGAGVAGTIGGGLEVSQAMVAGVADGAAAGTREGGEHAASRSKREEPRSPRA